MALLHCQVHADVVFVWALPKGGLYSKKCSLSNGSMSYDRAWLQNIRDDLESVAWDKVHVRRLFAPAAMCGGNDSESNMFAAFFEL